MTTAIHNNNNTTKSWSSPFPNVFTEKEKQLMYIAYVCITIVGLSSNFAVCFVILKYRHLRVIVNILILNLAISDIVACLSVYPFVFVDSNTTGLHGTSANMLCGITEGLSIFFIVATVSLLTLSVLSMSRYIVINHPLRINWRLKKGSIKYIFTLIWITSAALLIPSSVSFKYDETKKFCFREWAPGIHTFTYFIFTGLLGFFIPIFSLSFTYVTSVYTLWWKKSNVPNTRLSGSSLPNGNIRVKKRVSVLLGMLIVVYLLCWMPFAIYWLLSAGIGYYDGSDEMLIKGIRLNRVTVFIALSNTVLNPLVYAFTNVHLRTAFWHCIRCRKLNAVAQRRSMTGGPTLVSYTARRHTIHPESPIHIELKDFARPRELTL
jgi:7 transmembrane receptor (rhodopsin family).